MALRSEPWFSAQRSPRPMMDLPKWGCPRSRRYFFGVPEIRIIIYWGLYWAPLILGSAQTKATQGHPGDTDEALESLERYIGVILGFYWGYNGVMLGLYWGYIGAILRLYWVILGLYWGYIGVIR